jgi:hypothetical protein
MALSTHPSGRTPVELGVAGGREWREPTTLRSGSARDYLTLPIRVIPTFVQTAIGMYLADIALLEAAAEARVVAVLTFVDNVLEEWQNVTYTRG